MKSISLSAREQKLSTGVKHFVMSLIMMRMASYQTISALTAARLPLAAGSAVAGRKLMGSAGLRQPAAHS